MRKPFIYFYTGSHRVFFNRPILLLLALSHSSPLPNPFPHPLFEQVTPQPLSSHYSSCFYFNPFLLIQLISSSKPIPIRFFSPIFRSSPNLLFACIFPYYIRHLMLRCLFFSFTQSRLCVEVLRRELLLHLADLQPASRHCKENPIFVFLFWEQHSLSPNFHIHVSVSDLYIIPGLVHIFPCCRIR